MRRIKARAPVALLAALALARVVCPGQEGGEARARKIEEALKADVPRVLCVSERVTTGGQPAEAAFARLAAEGFRAVLDMRTEAEGHDAARERALVEAAGMRYLSLPVASDAPRAEQVAEFTRAVKEARNHPLFVHCASGNRVGAFWLIHRVVEDGWTVERAAAEAERVGLRSEKLKRFALDYLEARGAGK